MLLCPQCYIYYPLTTLFQDKLVIGCIQEESKQDAIEFLTYTATTENTRCIPTKNEQGGRGEATVLVMPQRYSPVLLVLYYA